MYLPRLADDSIKSALGSSGAVLLEGPRFCGKTETARHHSQSWIYLDRLPGAAELANLNPSGILAGAKPRLIDEWQIAPDIWNHVRHSIDESQEKGQYILTGSAAAKPATNRHPGSGRIQRLRMRPMTLEESGLSSGTYKLSSLFAGSQTGRENTEPVSFSALVDQICIGGWPSLLGLPAKEAQKVLRSYLQDVVTIDFATLDGPSDSQIAKRILTAIARTVGQKTPVSKILELVVSSGSAIKHQTAQSYVTQFQKLWITEEIEAWVPQLRSRYTVNQASKRYLTDPSLAVGALSASPAKLGQDLKTLGFLFENLVARDLLSMMDHLGGQVRHYRDESGLEVDFIVENDEGSWGAIEVKLGYSSAALAADNLLKFSERVDTQVVGKPAFLAVVTNTDFSYQRPDGVHIISMAALGA